MNWSVVGLCKLWKTSTGPAKRHTGAKITPARIFPWAWPTPILVRPTGSAAKVMRVMGWSVGPLTKPRRNCASVTRPRTALRNFRGPSSAPHPRRPGHELTRGIVDRSSIGRPGGRLVSPGAGGSRTLMACGLDRSGRMDSNGSAVHCGRSISVLCVLPKHERRVRLPPPAPKKFSDHGC